MIEEIIKYISKLINEENKRLIYESNNDRIRARKHAIAIMKNIMEYLRGLEKGEYYIYPQELIGLIDGDKLLEILKGE